MTRKTEQRTKREERTNAPIDDGLNRRLSPGNPRARPANRPPSHLRGQDARPTGHPNWERHAMETAHRWEDELPEERPESVPPVRRA